MDKWDRFIGFFKVV